MPLPAKGAPLATARRPGVSTLARCEPTVRRRRRSSAPGGEGAEGVGSMRLEVREETERDPCATRWRGRRGERRRLRELGENE